MSSTKIHTKKPQDASEYIDWLQTSLALVGDILENEESHDAAMFSMFDLAEHLDHAPTSLSWHPLNHLLQCVTAWATDRRKSASTIKGVFDLVYTLLGHQEKLRRQKKM